MFSKEKYRHYFILSLLFVLSVFILFHAFLYYKAHESISHRAVAGIIIILVFFIQRLIMLKHDLKLFKLYGYPLENTTFSDRIERNTLLFREERKKKRNLMKELLKKIQALNIKKDIFSKLESKFYIEKIMQQSMNLFLTLTIIAVLIIYKNLAFYYGVVGIGIAMFIGVSCAAYITSIIRILKNLALKRHETKFIRIYKLLLFEKKVEPIKDIMFFTDTFFSTDITLSILLNQEMKTQYWLFVFLDTYFLELNGENIINGVYESEESLAVYAPLSDKLIQSADDFIEKYESALDTDFSNIKTVFKKFAK